jgi:ribosomal protein S7
MAQKSLPANERASDELTGMDAYAVLEKALRAAAPDFHLYGHVKALTVSKAPRGVFVDVTFARRRGIGAQRVRGIVSRAWAESLRGQLTAVLDA